MVVLECFTIRLHIPNTVYVTWPKKITHLRESSSVTEISTPYLIHKLDYKGGYKLKSCQIVFSWWMLCLCFRKNVRYSNCAPSGKLFTKNKNKKTLKWIRNLDQYHFRDMCFCKFCSNFGAYIQLEVPRPGRQWGLIRAFLPPAASQGLPSFHAAPW